MVQVPADSSGLLGVFVCAICVCIATQRSRLHGGHHPDALLRQRTPPTTTNPPCRRGLAPARLAVPLACWLMLAALCAIQNAERLALFSVCTVFVGLGVWACGSVTRYFIFLNIALFSLRCCVCVFVLLYTASVQLDPFRPPPPCVCLRAFPPVPV